MSKFYGILGYTITKESTDHNYPGVWVTETMEHPIYGDIMTDTKRYENNTNSINDNITINKKVSIIADPLVMENAPNMKYVKDLGVKWKITSIDISYPRLILTLGGIYNGE